MVLAKLLQEYYFKNHFLGRSHVGTVGAKTSQWRPLQVTPRHVPYLPYHRYATALTHNIFVTDKT